MDHSSKLLATTSLITALSIPSITNAALVSRLGGLAYYDTEADLTWLADANAVGGTMDWNHANAWVAGLDVAGVTGWRLPTTSQPDYSCTSQSNGVSSGYNCSGSEMGNLFHNVLGNNTGSFLTNKGPFNNFSDSIYWSATLYAPNNGLVWTFNMGGGHQYTYAKNYSFSAWAVHTGDIGSVPLPASIWLFLSGSIGLIGFSRKK
jgi:hypothetical protein